MSKPIPRSLSRLRGGDRWAGSSEVVFGRLWLEFLLVSPSYELARRHRTGQPDVVDEARIPADFATVLSVYDDLGDVRRVSFDEWWLEKGLRYFGYQGEPPTLEPIDVLLKENPKQLETALINYDAHIKGAWREQGKRPSAIIAIPLNLNRTEIMEQLGPLLDFYDKTLKPHKQQIVQPPKYPLHGEKQDINSLIRYVTCICVKASSPDLKLFEVGGIAGLSSTYSSRFVADKTSVEDRHALKILTSRALNRAMMIAENAARGIFPSYNRCENAVSPNWVELAALLETRQSWEDEQI